MTKKEFLDILRENLAGNLPAAEIEENIQYYKDYIENGEESEEKALEILGDPHLIARTVIDSFKISKGPMADFYTEQARNEYNKDPFDENTDSRTNYEQYENRNIRPQFKWYHKLIAILIIVAVVAIILVLGGLAAVVIVRVILPVLLVIIILRFISNNFGKG